MSSVKKYVVDLDKPEKERWNEIINDNKENCLHAFKEMDKMAKSNAISRIMSYVLETIAKYYLNSGKALYIDELKSISEILNVPVEKVLMCQLCYEMAAACTSVGMNINGKMYHYRTMDWDMVFLKALTIHVQFKKNNKLLFEGITWAGYIGILTAMVPNEYSLSINYRRSNGNLIGNIMKASKMHWPIGYLCRNLLESETSFDDFIKILDCTDLISPCYVTLCHKSGNSVVLIRDSDKCVDKITSSTCVIQTNKDPGPTDVNILYSCEREKLVNSIIGNDLHKMNNAESIISVFNKYPIINEETVYVSVLVPEESKIMTYLP